MKKLYILLFAILPMLVNAQYSVDADHDSVKVAEVGDDVEFHHYVKNTGNDTVNLKWRLFPDFTGVDDWEDYVCEGILLCFPSTVRSNEFSVASGDSVEIFHHVEAKNVAGTGDSKICFFDPSDSSNTVNCVTVQVEALMPDTLEVYIGSQAVYVIDGDTYEIYDGTYVPLGVEDEVIFDVELGQNVPNPFKDNTTISYSLDGMNGEVLIHDLTGKLIQKHVLHAQAGKIQLGSDLQAGMYFYSLYNDGQHVDTKRMQVLD